MWNLGSPLHAAETPRCYPGHLTDLQVLVLNNGRTVLLLLHHWQTFRLQSQPVFFEPLSFHRGGGRLLLLLVLTEFRQRFLFDNLIEAFHQAHVYLSAVAQVVDCEVAAPNHPLHQRRGFLLGNLVVVSFRLRLKEFKSARSSKKYDIMT